MVISESIKLKLTQIPSQPGIYKMLDKYGDIIYIGKSQCLKKRVRSYFTSSPKWPKVNKMLPFIKDIDYTLTDTHLEARLLECQLIKELKPPFNAQMKNDKKYVYLKLNPSNKTTPLSIVNNRENNTLGPFRNKYLLQDTLTSLDTLFPIHKAPNGTYLFTYHILPIAMDDKTQTINKEHLLEVFSQKENMTRFINQLEQKMQEASALYKFETASKYKEMIKGMSYINASYWQYDYLMSKNFVLKIPIKEGIKVFYIHQGTVMSGKRYKRLTQKSLQCFINNPPLTPFITINSNDKANKDFRDILFSEIQTLPKDSIYYL